ncbi:hypothetical protein DW989_04480 [Bacteroides stercoris]|jgi:hypothetical protein|nr:hypothetical protein DW989_04480 [Bacteroides stercoris]UVX99265.1 MAG: hypothetical protein [Bacteriophage sp.]DAK50234.1 MAG TPA: hypothetical protein [Caudoviricetes sp.]
MSKYGNTITLILSAISIMVSVAALCRTYPHTSDLGMDYQGVIVGMLALLVTILIGWQIYTAINVKEELKDIKDLRREINKQERDIYIRSTNNLFEFQSAMFMMYDNKKEKSNSDIFQLYLHGISSIYHLCSLGKQNECTSIVNILIARKSILMSEKFQKEQIDSLMDILLSAMDISKVENAVLLVNLLSVAPIKNAP